MKAQEPCEKNGTLHSFCNALFYLQNLLKCSVSYGAGLKEVTQQILLFSSCTVKTVLSLSLSLSLYIYIYI